MPNWVASARNWLAPGFQKVWARLKEGFLTILAGVIRVWPLFYIVLVVICYFRLPAPDANVHYTASRYMGANTRLAPALLIAANPASLEDRLRLGHEQSRLIGRYLRRAVSRGGKITPENTLDWPRLTGEQTAVEVDVEPDWMILNEGAAVEVWAGDKMVALDAVVLAIVPFGQPLAQRGPAAASQTPPAGAAPLQAGKWLVLLRSIDVAADRLGPPATAARLRVVRLPDAPP